MAGSNEAASPKNKSEILFEAYLRAHGHPDFEFEPIIEGTTRRPDYRFRHDGVTVLCEVKELRGTPEDFRASGGFFDPYPPVREKIHASRKKFKDIDGYPCCLVLHNLDKPLAPLDWEHVYGAMLGNLGFSVPINVGGLPAPDEREIQRVFTTGGKMIRERGGVQIEPQNRTISAVVVLGRFPVGDRLFHSVRRGREEELGRGLTIDELLSQLDEAAGTERDLRRRQLRVVVHENPYARIALPESFFRGPYDERYGGRDGRIQCLFQGDSIAALPPKE